MAEKLKQLQTLLEETNRRGDRAKAEQIIQRIQEIKSNESPSLSATGKKTSEGRPIYKDAKGDYVTERTVTVTFPDEAGNEVIVNAPTVYDGRIVPEADALDRVIKSGGRDPVTGRDLERFRDMGAAVEAAKARSNALGQEVNKIMEGPGFAERVGARIDARLEKIAQTAKDQLGSGKMQQSPWSTTLLRGAGNTIAIPLEVLGEGASTLLEKAAEEYPVIAKAVLGGLRDAAEFEKEHLNLSGAIKTLRKKYPEHMEDVDAIANILLVATPAKTPNRLPSVRVGESLEKTRMKFVNELLTNKSTKKARMDLARRASQKGKDIIIQHTKEERAVAREVSKIKGVSYKNSVIENNSAIKAQRKRLITELDNRLIDSGAKFDKNILGEGIDLALKKGLEDTLKNSPATPALMDIAEKAKRAIEKHPNTPKGLWEARKEFDQVVKAERPTAFDFPQKTYNKIVHGVRQEMNDMISAYAPGRDVKSLLSRQSNLYKAEDMLLPKIERIIKEEAPEKIMQSLKDSHVVFSKFGALKAAGLGTGAASAVALYYLHQPMLAGIVGGFTLGAGTYKAIAKAVVSPMTRQVIKEALQVTEKALAMSKLPAMNKRLKAHRAALWEMYNAIEED